MDAFIVHRIDSNVSASELPHAIREKDNPYGLISPLLFYERPDGVGLEKDSDLEKTINNIIKKSDYPNDNTVSIYYRNGDNWLGINENQKFTPASLLKVVVMIAYLQKADSNPQILTNQIKFTSEIKNLISEIPYDQGTKLVLGQSYAVNDLINRMIIDSDNGAAYTLISNIPDGVISEVYTDLGLDNPEKANGDYTISAHQYTFFLRILYNSTYLSREMSEHALTLLSQTKFESGLVAGIPNSIKVAHKYGESILINDKKTIEIVELHDCGIIYYPKRPYMLCIMTKGKSLSDLSNIISNISKAVYNKVQNP
ncbi:class A beta-lactamase-related serine hydrolase [Candidatus Parcubacteria bacterium]|nr:class A beta-lactamase-related serine hydrolase [Candidatus Parcubacteria bacterium]